MVSGHNVKHGKQCEEPVPNVAWQHLGIYPHQHPTGKDILFLRQPYHLGEEVIGHVGGGYAT